MDLQSNLSGLSMKTRLLMNGYNRNEEDRTGLLTKQKARSATKWQIEWKSQMHDGRRYDRSNRNDGSTNEDGVF